MDFYGQRVVEDHTQVKGAPRGVASDDWDNRKDSRKHAWRPQSLLLVCGLLFPQELEPSEVKGAATFAGVWGQSHDNLTVCLSVTPNLAFHNARVLEELQIFRKHWDLRGKKVFWTHSRTLWTTIKKVLDRYLDNLSHFTSKRSI